MKPRQSTIALAVVFCLGCAVGVFAGKGGKVSSDLYRGQNPQSASEALLKEAHLMAGNGTWENIAVGQILYLSGQESEAEAIFDGLKKRKGSEWIRIGRIYYRAGHWDKAKDAFERVVAAAPEDADWLAEIGAYYNLQGDRDRAEELFDRSFAEEPKNLYNTLKAAGSYVGVEER